VESFLEFLNFVMNYFQGREMRRAFADGVKNQELGIKWKNGKQARKGTYRTYYLPDAWVKYGQALQSAKWRPNHCVQATPDYAFLFSGCSAVQRA
jgi:hypothetical protein